MVTLKTIPPVVGEVFLIRNKKTNQIEGFTKFDDAMNAGADYISQMGKELNWTQDEIDDEICYFFEYKTTDMVEFYFCSIQGVIYHPREITRILNDFRELKEYALEHGGSSQEQRIENLRLMVEKELKEIFEK